MTEKVLASNRGHDEWFCAAAGAVLSLLGIAHTLQEGQPLWLRLVQVVPIPDKAGHVGLVLPPFDVAYISEGTQTNLKSALTFHGIENGLL